MSPFFDVNNSLTGKLRPHAFIFIRIFRFCKRAVNFTQPQYIRFQLRRHRADTAGKLRQNALDLFLFRRRKLAQFVIHFQDFFGFNEKRRTARRTIMHKTANTRFVFRAHGQNISVVAHRDDAFLQIFCAVPAQKFGQSRADPLIQRTNGAAYIIQLVARAIAHFIFRQNLFRDILFQNFIKIDARDDFFEKRSIFQCSDRTIRHTRGTKQTCHSQKLPA